VWVCVMAAYGPISTTPALCPTRSWPSSAGLRILKTGIAYKKDHKQLCVFCSETAADFLSLQSAAVCVYFAGQLLR